MNFLFDRLKNHNTKREKGNSHLQTKDYFPPLPDYRILAEFQDISHPLPYYSPLFPTFYSLKDRFPFPWKLFPIPSKIISQPFPNQIPPPSKITSRPFEDNFPSPPKSYSIRSQIISHPPKIIFHPLEGHFPFSPRSYPTKALCSRSLVLFFSSSSIFTAIIAVVTSEAAAAADSSAASSFLQRRKSIYKVKIMTRHETEVSYKQIIPRLSDHKI